MSIAVAADAVIPERLRPAITDPLPYLSACERRHLNMLRRRADHLEDRLGGDADRPGNSWDRSELNSLRWAVVLLEETVRARTSTPLDSGCPHRH